MIRQVEQRFAEREI
jgi:hypothetical protein